MPSAQIRLALLAALLLSGLPAWSDDTALEARRETVRILVQSSPLAGSQYYGADTLWPAMQVGDALTLHREPDNRHDPKAVRIEWHGAKLGYLPRRENGAVAAAMDRGERLEARISRLTPHKNPWRRVEVQVWAKL